MKGVDDCISTSCERKALLTAELIDCRESIRIELDRRVYALQKMSYRNNLKVFQDSVVKQAFTELYYRYVLVHVDKTTSNTVIICRRLYALTLITKFVLDRDTRNYTTNYHEICSHFQED